MDSNTFFKCLEIWNRRISLSPPPPGQSCLSLSQPECTVDEVLNLLRHLYTLFASPSRHSAGEEYFLNEENKALGFSVPREEFISKKITNKLVQQLQDPLVLSSRALPAWCEDLTYSAPMLFPFDTRSLYFGCTAYGTSRFV